GEVLHQQRARALLDVALDLRAAAEAFRLLAHVLHGQREAIGDPGRIRNPGRLAACDRVELLETHVAHDGGGRELADGRAHSRVRDELADVDVDRTRPARGEDKGLVLREMHRLYLEHHLRRRVGDEGFIGAEHVQSVGKCGILTGRCAPDLYNWAPGETTTMSPRL